MRKILYFDCFSGISGDMTIGALLDLGIDHEKFLGELKKLGLEGYKIEIKKGLKKGITGTNFDVILEHHHEQDHHHVHRNIHDIEHIINKSELDNAIKEMSKKIFHIVAEAEAKVHGKSIDEVHFHEVGAIDSIVDIVGTAVCIHMLGIDEIYTSPLHVGCGFVKCAHGIMPVPAPATLEILKDVSIYNNGIQKELVTPTGAAIAKALSNGFGDILPMTVKAVGYGLGKRDLNSIPNVLRIYLGEKKNL